MNGNIEALSHADHLKLIYGRMHIVHGEDPNMDYMRRFSNIIHSVGNTPLPVVKETVLPSGERTKLEAQVRKLISEKKQLQRRVDALRGHNTRLKNELTKLKEDAE